MKVRLLSVEDERECRQAFVVEIDGKQEMSFFDGEPEDNSLGRNFNDVYAIGKLLIAAHEAGKRSEELVVESADVDWDDL